MEKFKICSNCGTINSFENTKCQECGTVLENLKIKKNEDLNIIFSNDNSIKDDDINLQKSSVSEKKEKYVVNLNKKNDFIIYKDMAKICECGKENPFFAKKCSACKRDLSNVFPVKIPKNYIKFILKSIDGKYSYNIEERSFIIGREYEMKEYLSKKAYVSRMHAEISVENNKLYIRNLSKTNYTYINNVKAENKTKSLLNINDEIGLGGIVKNGKRQDEAAYFIVTEV